MGSMVLFIALLWDVLSRVLPKGKHSGHLAYQITLFINTLSVTCIVPPGFRFYVCSIIVAGYLIYINLVVKDFDYGNNWKERLDDDWKDAALISASWWVEETWMKHDFIILELELRGKAEAGQGMNESQVFSLYDHRSTSGAHVIHSQHSQLLTDRISERANEKRTLFLRVERNQGVWHAPLRRNAVDTIRKSFILDKLTPQARRIAKVTFMSAPKCTLSIAMAQLAKHTPKYTFLASNCRQFAQVGFWRLACTISQMDGGDTITHTNGDIVITLCTARQWVSHNLAQEKAFGDSAFLSCFLHSLVLHVIPRVYLWDIVVPANGRELSIFMDDQINGRAFLLEKSWLISVYRKIVYLRCLGRLVGRCTNDNTVVALTDILILGLSSAINSFISFSVRATSNRRLIWPMDLDTPSHCTHSESTEMGDDEAMTVSKLQCRPVLELIVLAISFSFSATLIHRILHT
jgi:hypothetical protein